MGRKSSFKSQIICVLEKKKSNLSYASYLFTLNGRYSAAKLISRMYGDFDKPDVKIAPKVVSIS